MSRHNADGGVRRGSDFSSRAVNGGGLHAVRFLGHHEKSEADKIKQDYYANATEVNLDKLRSAIDEDSSLLSLHVSVLKNKGLLCLKDKRGASAYELLLASAAGRMVLRMEESVRAAVAKWRAWNNCLSTDERRLYRRETFSRLSESEQEDLLMRFDQLEAQEQREVCNEIHDATQEAERTVMPRNTP